MTGFLESNGKWRLNVDLRVDVAVGVDVGGERGDVVVVERERALATEEAEFLFGGGFAELEREFQFEQVRDVRAQAAAEGERV